MKNEQKKSVFKQLSKSKIKALLIAISAIVAIVLVASLVTMKVYNRKTQAKVITTSTLKEIVKTSDLSTFQSTYNGIAKVMNEDKPEDVDYYVAYAATVKAGIDFKKVKYYIDQDSKTITVNLPKVKINKINVDITSLDYIFINKKANTSTVSEQAYKKCIDDVTNECNQENAIFELAKKTAQKSVEALIKPFVEQLDGEFKLIVE